MGPHGKGIARKRAAEERVKERLSGGIVARGLVLKRKPKVPPLKLSLSQMRNTLTLLKLGKLIQSGKKSR